MIVIPVRRPCFADAPARRLRSSILSSLATKFPALCLAILISASPLAAAEWPAAIEHYEALALAKSKSGAAMWQLWKYAVATGRVEELKARWEEKAREPEGRNYRLLLAFLA